MTEVQGKGGYSIFQQSLELGLVQGDQLALTSTQARTHSSLLCLHKRLLNILNHCQHPSGTQ